MATLLQVEIRTDAAGTYTAYVYADGHTETNPPGRPKSKEDVMRDRALQVSKANAKNAVATNRAATGTSTSPMSNAARREVAGSAGARLILSSYRSFQHAVGELVDTASAPQTAGGLRDTLLTTVHTGTPKGEKELVLEDDLNRLSENAPMALPKRGR